jgi:hypothetical protein
MKVLKSVMKTLVSNNLSHGPKDVYHIIFLNWKGSKKTPVKCGKFPDREQWGSFG